MVVTGLLRRLTLAIACGIALGALLCAGGCAKKVVKSPLDNAPKAEFVSKLADIKDGMSYEEVAKVIGTPGTSMAYNPPEGAKASDYKRYQWIDSNNNQLQCIFVQNKLTTKDPIMAPGQSLPAGK